MSPNNQAVIDAAVAFVKTEVSGNDSSHDWFHIERVWKLSKTLAGKEGLNEESIFIVELSALLHDIKDWKYSGSDHAGIDAAREFLVAQNVAAETVERIVQVISSIGYKEELKGGAKNITPELAVVQDADRLDAIGAIGIARCLTFGGAKNRVLHDPEIKPRLNLTKEEYQANPGTSLNHFYEKLLLLKDLMKSESGKQLAKERHEFLEEYLRRFHAEWEGQM